MGRSVSTQVIEIPSVNFLNFIFWNCWFFPGTL
jgi:hypothetical protein